MKEVEGRKDVLKGGGGGWKAQLAEPLGLLGLPSYKWLLCLRSSCGLYDSSEILFKLRALFKSSLVA